MRVPPKQIGRVGVNWWVRFSKAIKADVKQMVEKPFGLRDWPPVHSFADVFLSRFKSAKTFKARAQRAFSLGGLVVPCRYVLVRVCKKLGGDMMT